MIVEAVDKVISVRGNNTAGELVRDMRLPQIPRCDQTTLHAPEHTGDTVRRALNRQIAPVGQVPTDSSSRLSKRVTSSWDKLLGAEPLFFA